MLSYRVKVAVADHLQQKVPGVIFVSKELMRMTHSRWRVFAIGGTIGKKLCVTWKCADWCSDHHRWHQPIGLLPERLLSLVLTPEPVFLPVPKRLA